MLKVFDSVCSRMGMCVNAAKTELMTVGHVGDLLEIVQLSGGVAQYVSSFKYLGGIVDTSEADVNARISKAKGRFAQMQMQRLRSARKMQCFWGYVLPVLLFGGETWALKQSQVDGLEVVHQAQLIADPEPQILAPTPSP